MLMRPTLFLASCTLATILSAQNHPGLAPPTTTVRFERMEHDFGWVLQDSENSHVFTFTNSGSEPLVIESARGSCGCTVPEYDKAPILPGAQSGIRVVYKPGRQEGHQVKTVTIVANTKPAQTLLRIHAEVLLADPGEPSPPYVFEPLPPPVEPVFEELTSGGTNVFDPLLPPASSADDRVPNGPPAQARFEVMEHDFGQVPQGSENPHVFTFKNTSDVPLIISNAIGSCGCTVPFYAKDPIPPGAESEIHVVYKPGKQQGHQSKTVTITANTEPRETILRIQAEVLVVDSVQATELFIRNVEDEAERKAIEEASPGCFVLFPNPTSNELRLDLKEHIGKSATVRVHDTTGRDLLNSTINHISSETSRLDVSSFPAGIYIATIQVAGGEPMSQCFVVDR